MKKRSLDTPRQMHSKKNTKESKKSSMTMRGFQVLTIRMVKCTIFGGMRKMSGVYGGKLHLSLI